VALSDADAAGARRLPERAVPRRLDALLFSLKVSVFRAQRFAAEFGRGPARLSRGDAALFGVVVAESKTPLWGDPRLGERAMQQGKVHNLRAAARRLDRTVLPAGAVFSFWRQMGRARASRGFANGRMLQEGCLVPATGGGLCQLSNALYDVALSAGCEIVERHAHSRVVPGSTAARGRDATVAWNYVDLRFAAPRAMMLRVVVERDALVVQLLSPPPCGEVVRAMHERVGAARSGALETSDSLQDAPTRFSTLSRRETTSPQGGGESCGTCDETSCFRHEGKLSVTAGRTAFVVDENWPEFRAYVTRTRKDDGVLALPLDGARWRTQRYAWKTGGFARVEAATAAALARSLALRFAKPGPATRAAELRGAEALAARLARALTADVTDVVVAQSLLPYLWRDGHLGGRRFAVLMTRMPMAEIQARLNAAASLHPERKTLADFRADAALVTAETEALAAADAVVTPHAEIAALFGARAERLDWHRSAPRVSDAARVAKRIAFVGPTIARKGAYEVRDAARALDLEVVLVGSELEGAGFWDGVRTLRAGADWLDGISVVVQPALLEDAPRRLLLALASGVPVIATRACGLPEEVYSEVPCSNAQALIMALRDAFG
jgi:glycosyltransferase involved in cell wall biosynthesis